MIRTKHNISIRLIVATLMASVSTGVAQVTPEEAPVMRPAFSQLRMYAEVAVAPGQVTFGDVLSFDDADPQLIEAIRDLPVTRSASTCPGALMLSHDEVRAQLRSVGVNMALITLTGARVCRVTAVAQPAASGDASANNTLQTAPVLLASAPPADDRAIVTGQTTTTTARVHTGGVSTLQDAIHAYVARELAPYGEPEIGYGVGSEALLSLMAPPFSFSVRSAAGSPLGTRTFRVTISRDGRDQREVAVVAHVRLIRPVVVAERPLNLGQVIAPLDVRVEKRPFDTLENVELAEPGAVIGQQASRFMRIGEVVTEKDIKRAALVQRSQRVKLIQTQGGVHIEFIGSALESGGFGETIRVRVGESRRDRQEALGRVVGPGRVELISEADMARGMQ
ncbi:MAG: flagellar basal body P-ring formation protein FlgA [Phycisphaerales bacterium]|nr:flagellar basal body P-ring formation protein FlgA [Phycisphaerales bacterium]